MDRGTNPRGCGHRRGAVPIEELLHAAAGFFRDFGFGGEGQGVEVGGRGVEMRKVTVSEKGYSVI